MAPAPVRDRASQIGIVGVTPSVPGMKPLTPRANTSASAREMRSYERAVMTQTLDHPPQTNKARARLLCVAGDTDTPI